MQGGVKKVLEPLYEEDFKDFSYGFRPGRSAHRAIEYMYKEVVNKGICYIIDADQKNYFGSIPHGLLRGFIAPKEKDGVIRKMIDKCMKAGVLENRQVSYPEEGTPQGGLVSLLLSDMYLHYVLDGWFSEQIQPLIKGQSFIVRYADDFILGFANKQDAMRVMEVMPKLFGKYQLTLHPDKTKLIDLECKKGKSDRSFDLLEFTHYKGLSRKGEPVLKWKTSSKKLTKAIIQTEDWIKQNRHRSLKELITELSVKLRGHYSYYGINCNYKGINSYYEQVKHRLQKWLNRRGGKHKWTWEKFNTLIPKWLPLARPKIYHSFLTTKPILEEPYAGKPLVQICGGAGR
ncbi:MAG TPA: reverse transcriptase domain-containing protein [Bacteroidales bacterium]|nr:reverse transcriptase domain-containing protein [Bacteroidales bacterium]